MNLLTGIYSDQRPIIKCRVAPRDGFGNANEGGIEFRTLIDTGCTDSMITQSVVDKLKISPSEYGTNTTASEVVHDAPCYYVDFAFDMRMPNGEICRYKVGEAKATCFPDNPHHEVVVGMGILKCFGITFEPDFGLFTLIQR